MSHNVGWFCSESWHELWLSWWPGRQKIKNEAWKFDNPWKFTHGNPKLGTANRKNSLTLGLQVEWKCMKMCFPVNQKFLVGWSKSTQGRAFSLRPPWRLHFNTSISPTVTWWFSSGITIDNLKSEPPDLCVISSTSCGMVADTRTTWKLWRCVLTRKILGSWAQKNAIRTTSPSLEVKDLTHLVTSFFQKAPIQSKLHWNTSKVRKLCCTSESDMRWSQNWNPMVFFRSDKIIFRIFVHGHQRNGSRNRFFSISDPILWHCHVIFRHRREFFSPPKITCVDGGRYR